MNQTLEGYTSRFWKNIFRSKYIDLVQSVQSYRVYRYPATSAKHFSFANTAVDSVVNATLNLARNSKTILRRERKMKNTQKKKITRNYHLLTKVESGKCRRVTAAIDVIRDLKQTLEAARWTPTGSKISRSRLN